jgi:diadenosine tetraphosphate (Ap4A) HIT family hydrolase
VADAADVADGSCLICSMEESDPARRVFLDELWAAEVAPGYEVPGWFFLRARRHAEKLTGLDEEETAAFGRRAHDLVSALDRVTGAPAVYLLLAGGRDVPAAQAVAGDVRLAYEEIVRGREHAAVG